MRRALLTLLLLLSVIVAACSAVDLTIEIDARALPTATSTPVGDDPYGTGIDGVREINEVVTLNQDCHPVSSGVGSSLHFTNTQGFATDRLLIVMQVAGTTSAGNFDLGRIETIDTSGTPIVVTLQTSMKHGYASESGAPRAQACTVPEYSTLILGDDAEVRADPWTGNSGGIVAFLVSSGFRMSAGATITADGAGFLGGGCVQNGSADSTVDDDPLGGEKGEGIAGSGGRGRARSANGGGGGNPRLAGGGGGAAGGNGGSGGDSASLGGTFGQAGLALVTSGLRLHLGGGGGGGHGQNGASKPNCDGGSGGGLVFIQALNANGGGSIVSRGAAPAAGAGNLSASSSGGGGGAGGLVWVIVDQGHLFHPAIAVVGGKGGAASTATTGLLLPAAAGGGGGGGWLHLGGFAPEASDVSGGAAGDGGATAATAGEPGTINGASGGSE